MLSLKSSSDVSRYARTSFSYVLLHRSWSFTDYVEEIQELTPDTAPPPPPISYEIGEVSSDDVLRFLNRFTEGNKPYTKRIRYSHICSFFNFIRNNLDHSLINPCDSPILQLLSLLFW